MGPELLMLAGALTWVAGELYAVARRRNETTSDYIADGRRLYGWKVRLPLALAVLWLTLHLVVGLPAGIFFGGN